MSVRNQEGKQRISETALDLLIKERMAGSDGDQTNKTAANFGVRITTQDHIQGGDISPDV
jgi:hypothetical protein